MDAEVKERGFTSYGFNDSKHWYLESEYYGAAYKTAGRGCGEREVETD